MFRILFLILIGYIIYALWKWTMRRYDNVKGSRRGAVRKAPTEHGKSQMTELIQCEGCKTYLAKEMAIQYKEHYFCSEQCRNSSVQ